MLKAALFVLGSAAASFYLREKAQVRVGGVLSSHSSSSVSRGDHSSLLSIFNWSSMKRFEIYSQNNAGIGRDARIRAIEWTSDGMSVGDEALNRAFRDKVVEFYDQLKIHYAYLPERNEVVIMVRASHPVKIGGKTVFSETVLTFQSFFNIPFSETPRDAEGNVHVVMMLEPSDEEEGLVTFTMNAFSESNITRKLTNVYHSSNV